MCCLNPFACLTVPFKNRQAAARKAVEAEAVAAASTAAVSAGVKLPPPQDFAELPACARFYLERVGAAKDNFTLVTARQMGGFRHGKNLPWKVLDATQVVSPRVPAFFWTASCGFKPMMGLKGFDCRAGGQSKVDWRFWGWLPALSGSGQATDRAMLVRWLAEAPGYPQALLPSDLLRWEAVKGSENQARAVLSHSGTTVSGIFTFDEAGLVASFRSDDYTRPLPGGATETRTWIVRYSDHKLVPVKGALGGGKLVPAMYKAYRVEPSEEEYCYVMFAFEGVKAN